jgi:hypothetical protein
MPLSRCNEDNDESSFSSTHLPDNGQTELGMPQMRTIDLLQQSPVTVEQYELRATPPQLLQTADIVNAAVPNTAAATSVSTGTSSAVAVGADAGMATLSTVPAAESFVPDGSGHGGRGRGRETRGSGERSGGVRGSAKNYSDQGVDYCLSVFVRFSLLAMTNGSWWQRYMGLFFP